MDIKGSSDFGGLKHEEASLDEQDVKLPDLVKQLREAKAALVLAWDNNSKQESRMSLLEEKLKESLWKEQELDLELKSVKTQNSESSLQCLYATLEQLSLQYKKKQSEHSSCLEDNDKLKLKLSEIHNLLQNEKANFELVVNKVKLLNQDLSKKYKSLETDFCSFLIEIKTINQLEVLKRNIDSKLAELFKENRNICDNINTTEPKELLSSNFISSENLSVTPVPPINFESVDIKQDIFDTPPESVVGNENDDNVTEEEMQIDVKLEPDYQRNSPEESAVHNHQNVNIIPCFVRLEKLKV